MSVSVLAGFTSKQAFHAALRFAHENQIGVIDTFTPMAPSSGRSILPTAILIGGLVGTIASMLLQTYANVWAYPIDIGGRPGFSWPAFIPIAFENGILAAVLTGFFGYFVVNRLPSLYAPVDETSAIPRAMHDVWCIQVKTDEPHRVQAALLHYHPDMLEELKE